MFQESASLVDTAGDVSWPSLTDFTLAELRVLTKKTQIVQCFLDQATKDGGKAAAMWPGMTPEAFPQYQPFQDGDLRGSILHLVIFCWHMRKRKHGPPLHDFVEGFAGAAMITLHMVKRGLRGQRLDVDYHATRNIITHFRTWLRSWIYSKARALHWTTPLCSSFVILRRGPSGRRAEHQWWGDEAKVWAERGNQIMVRTALLALLSHALACHFVIEQLLNSVVFKTPPMSTVLSLRPARQPLGTMHLLLRHRSHSA